MKLNKKKFLSVLLFIFIVFLSFTVIFSLSFFKIKTIQIEGTPQLEGLSELKNEYLFFLSEQKLEDNLYKINPDIDSVTVLKEYPNKLSLQVQQAVPIALLQVSDGYYILSQNGRILQKLREKDKNLTPIHYYQQFHFQEYSVGEPIHLIDILDTLFFIEKFTHLGIVIDRVDITSLDMLLFSSGDKTYFLSSQKDKNEQYRDLKLILEKFKQEGKEYKAVDVRFNKPIIRI